MKESFKENWPLLLIVLGTIQMFQIIGRVEKERDAAIVQRDAALRQANELAKTLKELQPMARIQLMPEKLQPDD